jgi:uncharacterized membrane protein
MSFARALRHLFAAPWLVRRALPAPALERIEGAIAASEQRHRGEIRFAVEGALEFLPVARGLTPRERALDVFSRLKVWDTEENTGVLVYLQLVERHIEIIADRGIARRIPQAQWNAICARMEQAFRAKRYEAGIVAGIGEISDVLAAHFPSGADNADELSNKPAVL